VKSDRTLLKWYKKINKRFFDGACADDCCVRWASETEEKEIKWEEKYFGWAGHADNPTRHHQWEIILSRSLNPKPSLKLSSLAHEMIHIATKQRDDHGPAFEKWRVYISERGIFKKHALLKDTTIF